MACKGWTQRKLKKHLLKGLLAYFQSHELVQYHVSRELGSRELEDDRWHHAPTGRMSITIELQRRK